MKSRLFICSVLAIVFAGYHLNGQTIPPTVGIPGTTCLTYTMPLPVHNVAPTETWGTPGSFQIAHEIVVPSGHSLHITDGEYYFVEDGRIVVEPGGELIIQGPNTLISSCAQNVSWQGILVKGNTNAPSTIVHQGRMSITNEATISRAKFAFHQPNSAQNGGIIQAHNANFINNHHAASFLSYYGGNTISTFEKCTFKLDADFVHIANSVGPDNSDYIVPTQVMSWKTDGITFYGNSFINDFPYQVHYDILGDAIGVLDASIELDRTNDIVSTCGQPYGDQNFFKGWNNAVISRTAGNYSSHETLEVVGCKFENNLVGVKTEGHVKPIIFDNQFDNDKNVSDIVEVQNSITGDYRRRTSAIECVGTFRAISILSNVINFNLPDLAYDEYIMPIYLTPFDNPGITINPQIPRIAFNNINVSASNQPVGGELWAAGVCSDGYNSLTMSLSCNEFDLTGIDQGSVFDLKVGDVYWHYVQQGTPTVIPPPYGDHTVADINGTTYKAAHNDWSPYGSPCPTADIHHLNFNNNFPNPNHKLDFYEGSAGLPGCISSFGSVSPIPASDPNCNILPSWCDLFGSSGDPINGKKEQEADVEYGPISIYPNPASDDLYLDRISDVSIYSHGRLVLKKPETKYIDLRALKNGLYIIKTNAGTQKLIILR